LLQTGYAKEIWKLYEEGDLRPDTELTGLFAENTQAADVDDMLRIIESAIEEEKDKQERKIEAENQP
jgi:RIO kinase 1